MPEFTRACMLSGDSTEEVRSSLLKIGATPIRTGAEEDKKISEGIYRYVISYDEYAVMIIFSASGECSVAAQGVDVDATKNSLAELISEVKSDFLVEEIADKSDTNEYKVLSEFALFKEGQKKRIVFKILEFTGDRMSQPTIIIRKYLSND